MTSRTPLLPVDQQMRADAELGAAWRRLLAALPPRAHEDIVVCPEMAPDMPGFRVRLETSDARLSGSATLPEALDALTEALANR